MKKLRLTRERQERFLKALAETGNDEWAADFNKGDADAVAALYTADAYVLRPGATMVKGRADIQKFWAGATAASR